MSNENPIIVKIQRAIKILGGANFTASAVFTILYIISGEFLIALAAVLMALAGIGIFMLGKRITGKLKEKKLE